METQNRPGLRVIIDGIEYEPKPKPLLADAKVGDLCKTDLDEWIQIDGTSEPPSPILYHFDRPFKGNIIHTEPLAPEGSAEWAWQMAKLGIETKCIYGKIRISDSGMIEVCYNGMAYAMPLTQSAENRKYIINKIRECSPDGWQIYEPAPVEQPEPTHTYDITITDHDWKGLSQTWCGVPVHEADRIADALSHVSSSTTKPAYQVGDWVEMDNRGNIYQDRITRKGEEFGIQFVLTKKSKTLKYNILNGKSMDERRRVRIIRKLSPSEAIVPISIKGQIRPGCNESCFEISTPNGGWMEIGKEQIKDELELVESILKAQGDK